MPISTTELPIRRQKFITNCASVKCAKSAENQVMPINIYVAQSFAQLVGLGLHEKVIGNNVDKKPLPRITNIISNGCLP